MVKIAAGLMMYRARSGTRGVEVLLVHPGGPFFRNKDLGVWSIPKGEVDPGEDDLLKAAQREFQEETGVAPHGPFTYVGAVEQARRRKRVEAWAFAGTLDPAAIVSNTCGVEWPPRSGRHIEIPEVDRGAFFTPAEAKRRLYPYLAPLIDMFMQVLKAG